MTLFVSNLNYGADEEALRELFAPFGEIVRLYLVRDKGSGASRGFCFIEYGTEVEAERAILELNKTQFSGRRIFVREADPERVRKK